MPNPVAGIIGGGSVLSSIIGGKQQKRAAQGAANAQRESTQAGIDEGRRQFDFTQKILSPYVQAGQRALLGTPAPQQPTLLAQPPQVAPGAMSGAMTQATQGAIPQAPVMPNFRPIPNRARPHEQRQAQMANDRLQAQYDRDLAAYEASQGPVIDAQGATVEGVSPMGGAPGEGGLFDYIDAGQNAFQQQLALGGLGTPEEEQMAIQRIMDRPEYQMALQQGEEAILQNAAATGGVRGGNTQRALMNFRPQLLSQQIGNQFSRLGGFAGTGLTTALDVARMGQASAANTGAAAQTTGANVSNLLQRQGSAQADAALARGAVNAAPFSALSSFGGDILGRGLDQGAFDKFLRF